MIDSIKLLNLGCGDIYHPDWINVDVNPKKEEVIKADLIKGIPFDNDHFNAVYLSHVLEHFNKADGKNIIRECYRVLKSDGIIRVVVPNLEDICRKYLAQLALAVKGDGSAEINYDWMMLELYDQAVRIKSGGEMAKLWKNKDLPNESFIRERIGFPFIEYRKKLVDRKTSQEKSLPNNFFVRISRLFSKSTYKNRLRKVLFADELKYLSIGRFRMSGEIHQWMYDRFSLSRLLKEAGFSEIKTTDAFTSRIEGWIDYKMLDAVDDKPRKPDSIFMEGKK